MSAFNGIANTNTVNYVPVQATFDSSGNFITFIGPGGKAFNTASGLAINTTTITGGTSGRILYDNAGAVGEKATTGTGNVVLDNNPVFATDISVNSATVGLGSGSDIGTRQSNLAFGVEALLSNTSGTNNVALGGTTLRTNTTGGNNLAIGGGALFANTIGTDNVGIGFASLGSNINGSFNTGIGSSSLPNSRGSNNIGIGASANAVTTGSGTIGIGANSLLALTSGTNHIAIGDNVLASPSAGTNSIYIGANTDTDPVKSGAGAPIEQIVIGSGTLGNGNYTTTIGTANTVSTKLFGKLVITTYTVATLPTGSVGSKSFVTDATQTMTAGIGAIVAGGGANKVPVYHDGTNWRIG